MKTQEDPPSINRPFAQVGRKCTDCDEMEKMRAKSSPQFEGAEAPDRSRSFYVRRGGLSTSPCAHSSNHASTPISPPCACMPTRALCARPSALARAPTRWDRMWCLAWGNTHRTLTKGAD